MCVAALAGAAGGLTAGQALMAGAAMQGLGTMLQMRAEKNAQNARNAYVDANIARNRKLEQEAALSIGKSRDEFDRTDSFDPGVDNAATELAAEYSENTKPMPVSVVSKSGVPQIVADTQAEEFAAADAFNAQQNEALASLNSFGQYLKETINPALTQSSADTALMGNFMRGNSSVLQSELEAANQKAYSPLAQLLTGAGRTAVGYGLYSPTGTG